MPRGDNRERLLPDDVEIDRLIRQHPDGLSPIEIARLCGMTRSRVNFILNTALRKLRGRLTPEQFGL